MDDGRRRSGISPHPPVTIRRSHGPFFLTSVAIPRSHGLVFFLPLFRHRTSVTVPRIRSVRPWYGHWRPSLKYQKKTVWQTVVWPLAFKKTRSMRPWYGLWCPGAKCVRKKTLVWPLVLKNPGLTDRGVATVVTKFRMASGGLTRFIHVQLT